ncbi:MAG: small basic protein [Candidatus Brocadiia bacterium]
MSLHSSLRSSSALKRDRNVLSRAERIQRLEDEGKWEQGESVFGLPKVRVRKIKVRHRKEKEKAAAAEAAEAEAAAQAEGEAEAEAEEE